MLTQWDFSTKGKLLKKDHLKMTYSMDMELSYKMGGCFIREIGQMERKTDLENNTLQMDTFMKVNLKMIKCMD